MGIKQLFLWSISLLLLSFCSCKMMQQVDYPSPNNNKHTPHVTLKDGTNIPAQKLRYQWASKIVVNDTIVYDAKDVTYYDDGFMYYANIGYGCFAFMIEAGKVNIYRTAYYFTTSGHLPSRYASISPLYNRKIHDYIQLGDSTQLVSLTYKHLKTILPPHAAGTELLYPYKKNHIVAATLYGAGLCFAGYAFSLQLQSHNAGNFTPLYLLLGSGLVLDGSLLYEMLNRKKLYKAIMLYNEGK